MTRLMLSRVFGLCLMAASPAAWAQNPAPTSVSANTVTAPGSGAVARTNAARAGDTVNVLDYGSGTGKSGAQNAAAWIASVAVSCASAQYVVTIPAGGYNADTTAGEVLDNCAGSGNMVSIIGAGNAATLIAYAGTNNLLHVAPPGGQPNTGHGTISGLRIYRADNPTAGAAIVLDTTNSVTLENLEIDGAFTAIDCISCQQTYATNINIGGANTASGALPMRFRRASNASANINTSTNFLTNVNIQETSVLHEVVLNNYDGIWFTSGHIGFSSGSAFLVQPGFNASGGGTAADQLDGLHLIGVDLDGNSVSTGGLDFEHLASYASTVDGTMVSGGSCANVVGNCVILNDADVTNISFAGFITAGNTGEGWHIGAGSHISIAGGNNENNNTANGSLPAMYIGGTSSHVVVSGATFSLGAAAAIPNFIQVEDSADYVAIGTNDFQGSTGLDILFGSSGTHNQVPGPSTTTNATSSWVNWQLTGSGSGYFLNNELGYNMVQFFTNAGSANSDQLVIISPGSGGTVTVTAGGADGTSTPLTVTAGAAATMTLGTAAGPPIVSATGITAASLATSGTIAGSLCRTSAGIILYESGASSCTISLAKLKKIKGPMTAEEAHATLAALTPIDFSMKPRKGEKVDTTPRLGFTAENARAANPRLATYDGEGNLQAYDPNGILAALVVQVKEQQKTIDRLQLARNH